MSAKSRRQPGCEKRDPGRQPGCRFVAGAADNGPKSRPDAGGTRFAKLWARDPMARWIALTALLALTTSAAACAVHEPVPVFRSAVFVGERGISVPLPPPSLTAMPKQDVDVEGGIEGQDEIEGGTVLRIVDNRGDGDVSVPLDGEQVQFSVSINIDLSDACLEMWLVAPDGSESQRSLFSTRIVDDQTVEVVEGCNE